MIVRNEKCKIFQILYILHKIKFKITLRNKQLDVISIYDVISVHYIKKDTFKL